MINFDRVVIVGVGLLGGSIGLALRDRGLARSVVGVGRSKTTLANAYRLHAITEFDSDLTAACKGADGVFICTPVQTVASLAKQCIAALAPDALVTDVGSTKASICEQMSSEDHRKFCGSHPLAGSDKSGVEFADHRLFDDRLTIVTPVAATPEDLIQRTESLWQAIGSRTIRMTPTEHDEAVASTSHLPHVLASALAGVTPEQVLPLAASGWCDTTRIAAGNTELWRQIVNDNRKPLLAALRNFSGSLNEWISVLENDDQARLTELLEIGKQKRDSVGN